MKEKLLSLCMAFMLVLSLMPMLVVAAETSGSCGASARWQYDAGSKSLRISGSGAIDDYSGYDDSTSPWAAYQEELESVVIEEGITRIGNGAFGGEMYAGQYTHLKSVNLPSTLQSIGFGSFEGSAIESITLPDSLTEIGPEAFSGTSLKSIHIPESVKSMGYDELYGDYVAFPFECDTLSSITIDPNNPSYTAENNVVYDKNVSKILYFPNVCTQEIYTIPKTIKTVPIQMFWYNESIKGLVIPEEVELTCEFDLGGESDDLSTRFSLYYYGDAPQNLDDILYLGTGGIAYGVDIYYIAGTNGWDSYKAKDYYVKDLNDYWKTFKTWAPQQGTTSTNVEEVEYLYDTSDPGEDTKLPTDLLDKVTDSKSAADVVKKMTDGMTSEQKTSPTGVDLATLYAETAVSKAASKVVEGEVIISVASIADVEAAAKQAASAVETALVNGGVTTARYLFKTVTLTTDETGEITIKIDPDILTTKVDKIRVETPSYALTLKTADLAEDLTEVLTITAEEVGSGFAPGKANRKVTIKVTLPKGRTTNPVTISLPADKGAVTYQAVVKTDGSATSSKYNPATTTMDGKVNTSGTYTVQTNEKSFTDISNKSAEMQKAILYLTSKGIINGTSATTFSPNGTINRQQVAALLMRALGKVDNSAVASFKDVSAKSSLYHEIASSKKHKIVNGYSDNTFRGTNVISRAQIVTVAGRVLTSGMNYKAPSNASTYLAKYSDTVPDFAKEMVALATRENLVVYRTDGTFSGSKNMTRGDAAIILYRLFQRIW